MIKKVKFIRQYLFFYLLSLLVPLAMGVSFYGIVYRREYARIEAETLNHMQSGLERITQVMTDAERLSTQLLTNDELMNLSRIDALFSSQNIYKAASFIRKNSLVPISLLNDIFAYYFVIDSKRGYVFSKDMASPVISFFRFDFRASQVDGWPSYRALLDGAGDNGVCPEASGRLFESSKEYLPYIHHFVDTEGNSYFVVVLLDKERIEGLFHGIDDFDRSSFSLRQGGHLWLHKGVDSSGFLDGHMLRVQDRFLTKVTLPRVALEAELSQPRDLISRKINYVPFVTGLGMVGFLVIGAAFLIYLAYRSSRPLIDLAERIHGDDDSIVSGRNLVAYLKDWFDETRGKTLELEDLLSEQRTKLKTHFLSGLLNNTVPNPAEVPSLIKYSGIEFLHPSFFTILIQLQGNENALRLEWEHNFPLTLLSFQRRVYEIHGPQAFIIQTGLNEICVLVNEAELRIPETRDRLVDAATKWVSLEVQSSYVLGVSRVHQGWQEIHRCLKESRAALVYDWPNNQNSVNFCREDSRPEEDEVFFPQQIENGILEAIRTGQVRDLQKSLEHINRENTELRKLRHYAQGILVSRFQGLLLRASSRLRPLDDDLSGRIDALIASPPQDLGSFLRESEACLIALSKCFEQDLSRKEKEDADAIRLYLERSFNDNQLSLISTSENLGFSISYINRLVKKYYGKTFRIYMEDLRMEFVRNLILSTDVPIHVLIQRGGYNSMNTFCKAFKRKYGYNAASLREAAALEHQE